MLKVDEGPDKVIRRRAHPCGRTDGRSANKTEKTNLGSGRPDQPDRFIQEIHEG
jgi:hypothetical protein